MNIVIDANMDDHLVDNIKNSLDKEKCVTDMIEWFSHDASKPSRYPMAYEMCMDHRAKSIEKMRVLDVVRLA